MGKMVNIVVEDILSEAVVVALLKYAGGHKVSASYPVKRSWENGARQNGYGYIKKNLRSFNRASKHIPYVIVVDQDDRLCPPKTIADWLEGEIQEATLVVRIAIREIESWLLADKKGLSDFLGVPKALLPADPELLEDPKSEIACLAAQSKIGEIRNDIAPQPGTSSPVGPYYSRGLANFARNHWDIDAALTESGSLARAVRALLRL